MAPARPPSPPPPEALGGKQQRLSPPQPAAAGAEGAGAGREGRPGSPPGSGESRPRRGRPTGAAKALAPTFPSPPRSAETVSLYRAPPGEQGAAERPPRARGRPRRAAPAPPVPGLPALSRRLSSGRGRFSDPEHEPGASPGRSPGRLAPLRRDWAEGRRGGGRRQRRELANKGQEGRTRRTNAAPQSPMMRARKQP